ncbi:MAG: cyclic nucleotide-binding domain-containing protein [Deltaproteobacteria bacterium]|nr:cyclic nucleotide-binding domain-containing protein [Deltaproteobacteria bacterium]
MDEQDTSAEELISGRLAECAFVEKSHLFKGLQRNDLDHLYRVGRLRRFEAGEFILHEGDEGSELFLIESGKVKVVTQSASGVVELSQLSRGAFFGEVGLLTGKPRTATVMAMNDVLTICFQKDDLEPILLKYPRVRKLMQTMMNARAKAAIEKKNRPGEQGPSRSGG